MTGKPVILCIMDGWGHRENSANNAVAMAATPVIDQLDTTCPKSFLLASGPAVGLPEGQVGNSEVGHMTIGAGRVILQDLARIDAAVEDQSIQSLPGLEAFAERLLETGGTAHLMGLVSDGGVHSRDQHIMAIAEALTGRGIRVALHAFTDGRDTLPKMADKSLPGFVFSLPEGASLATVIGRYYPMDRDHRWPRTETAWQAITHARAAHRASNASQALANGYASGLSDEFIMPTVIDGYYGMEDGDAVVMANFRADRVRQLMAAFCLDECGFDTSSRPRLLRPLGLVPYSDKLSPHMDALFGPPHIPHTLGEVVAEAGLTQLRLAETEKYPHVTFFLNGGVEDSARGESRTMIASTQVATYDQQPEMSAAGVLDTLLDAIRSLNHDLIIVNFANPDMVGHTGVLSAAINAVETVDQAVGKVIEAVREVGAVMLITADHGNCEIMWDDEADCPHTAHSYNPVPAWLLGELPAKLQGEECDQLRDGSLADIAPTLLHLLGVEQPDEMTGRSLLLR